MKDLVEKWAFTAAYVAVLWFVGFLTFGVSRCIKGEDPRHGVTATEDLITVDDRPICRRDETGDWLCCEERE